MDPEIHGIMGEYKSRWNFTTCLVNRGVFSSLKYICQIM